MTLFYTPVNGKEAILISDWPNKKLIKEEAQAYVRENKKNTGVALVHGLSNTCAIDFDDLKKGLDYFSAIEVDIKTLLKDQFEVISPKQNTAKYIFKIPKGVTLERIQSGGIKLDLRAGPCYDVMPNSAYPKGGLYTHAGSTTIKELPQELVKVWQLLLSEKRKQSSVTNGKAISSKVKDQLSVIYAFNMKNSLEDVLKYYGYTEYRPMKWLSPNSTSGSKAGFNLIPSHTNPWLIGYNHHGSDEQLKITDRAVDAFEVAAQLTFPDKDIEKARIAFTAVQSKKLMAIDYQTGEEFNITINEYNKPKETEELIEHIASDLKCEFTSHSYPSGFMGKLAREIEDMMHFPNKEIAIISARHIIVALSGRKASLDDTRITIQDFLLADQGVGKETVAFSLTKVIEDVINYKGSEQNLDFVTRIKAFEGCKGSYGVQALHKFFVESPSCSVIVTEAGVASKSNAGDTASLDAYMLANVPKNCGEQFSFKQFKSTMPNVYGAGMAVLEESVLLTAKHLITPEFVAGGALARRSIIVADHKPSYNRVKEGKSRRTHFSTEILEGIYKIAFNAMEDENYEFEPFINDKKATQYKGPTGLRLKQEFKQCYYFDKECQELHNELYSTECDARINSKDGASTNPVKWAIGARLVAKAKHEALLLAHIDWLVNDKKGEKTVTIKHFKEGIAFIKECDRATLANMEGIAISSGSELLDIAAQAYLKFESKLATKTPVQEARIFRISDIHTGTSKTRMLIKKISEETRRSFQAVREEMLIQGQDEGYWTYYKADRNHDFRVKFRLKTSGAYVQLNLKPL